MRSREEGLKMNQAEEHDDYMYEKGRQDAIDEVKELYYNKVNEYTSTEEVKEFMKEFYKKLKVIKMKKCIILYVTVRFFDGSEYSYDKHILKDDFIKMVTKC
jgi:hypothetical protein